MEFEVPEGIKKQQIGLLEKIKGKGKVKVGVNEVTKAVEREVAKLVLIAKDVDPKEIVMHIPIICKEKNIVFSFVDSKAELGKATGISVGTSVAAVVDDGGMKKELEELTKKIVEISN